MANFRDQDLRDTAVTWLADAGATHLEIASITGHSLQTIATILKHYCATTLTQASSAIRKLVAYLEWGGGAVMEAGTAKALGILRRDLAQAKQQAR